MSRQAPPVLRTPRLTLRPLEMTDADALVRGVGNYEVSRWLSVVPYPYTHGDAAWFLERTIENRALVWAICDEDSLQGCIGIEDGLGYWLARPAWRKGYGFEAARVVIAQWFTDTGRRSATSAYFQGNERSGAVLRALGFRPTGEAQRKARALSQDVMATEMAMSREQWQARLGFTVFTPRLTLRPIISADAPALVSLAVPEVTRGTASLVTGWAEADAREWIEGRRWAGLPGFMLGIEREGALIGAIGCGGTPLSVMYFLGPDHWGQGLATEALSAFLPEIFDRFPVTNAIADHFEDSPASGRLLEKHGFRVTGDDMATSKGRLEPSRVITYAVTRDTFRVAS